MLTTVTPATADPSRLQHNLLPAETDFYCDYDWSLDPHLTVGEAIGRLTGEIDRLAATPAGWQTAEVTSNVYLLACSLLNGIDEYLRGHALRLPAELARTRPGRVAAWVTDNISEIRPKPNHAQVHRWKEEWQNGLDTFFCAMARRSADPASYVEPTETLAAILQLPLPAELLDLRLGVPSAFSRLDLTHFDVLALGREYMRQFPDKSHPVLLLGLRTAGTYFSALLRSFFKTEGYRQVSSLTVQPKKGPSRWERKELRRHARQGFTLVIVDDPPHSGGTIVRAVEIGRHAGFELDHIKVLVPTHLAARNWAKNLPDGFAITLEPERWYKQQLLEAKNVESRLTEYYGQNGFSAVRLVDGRQADRFSGSEESGSKHQRGATLKRVFEVQLCRPDGQHETRFVLAKSVGQGYLGYQAVLTAVRLSDFVPPVLGLRDGILYSEWLPQPSDAHAGRTDRDAWIETTAAYIAARTRLLGLPKGRSHGKAVHENGIALLAESLGRAYGRFIVDVLMRSWIQHRLYRLHCPLPTLIDGNMGRDEWIEGQSGPLKTGYHRHGLGKTQINVIDPAYDLAETILSFELSPEQEARLIRRYAEYSGDVEVEQRLFLNKLLAGLWTMSSAHDHLFGAMQVAERQQLLHARFLNAWNFLTIQTARFCGSRCRSSQPVCWRTPMVMLDVDGVLDRRIFGYPSTTAAGMEALSLLARHGCSVALNTARSVPEVRDYCQAYGLSGGVAEHGAYIWDAVAQRGQVLIDQETVAQLETLRTHLRRIPGIFLDHRHRYSIRAFMFEKQSHSLLLRLLSSIRSFGVGQGVPTPLPTLTVDHLITTLRLDRLSFHHTKIDTAIVAKGTDKGAGLKALRDWALGPDAQTIAIGDTEADLPMFRAATRSFAPAQLSCRREARLLGCTVSRYRYQRGLLDIVRTICGSGSDATPHGAIGQSESEALFLELLRAADCRNVGPIFRALFDRATFGIFVR
jgi:hydroxymethylpyrimidine pyrophosphatase-like HAD family hydrolase